MRSIAKLLAALSFVMLAGGTQSAELKTIDERVAEFGAVVQSRLSPQLQAAGIPYPPKAVTLIAIKQTRVLELWAAGADGSWHFIRTYPVLAASGLLGPKLREGDRQVPEGVYRLRELNPNSLFHLSLWIDYPNEFDRAQAAREQRSDLGGEIMIHGDAVSKGCLAVGDAAAEDLFVLAALTRIENVGVILTPVDFRKQGELPSITGLPEWTRELYALIERELAQYSHSPPPQ